MTPTKLAYIMQATQGATALASTTPVQIFPAAAVTESAVATNLGGTRRPLCNYLTDLQISNGAATAAVITILDGATTIFTCYLSPTAVTPPPPFHFTTPLKGSPNTIMYLKSSAAGANVYWNAQGFVAAANL